PDNDVHLRLRVAQEGEVAGVARDPDDGSVDLVEGESVPRPAVGRSRPRAEAHHGDVPGMARQMGEDLSERPLANVVAERLVTLPRSEALDPVHGRPVPEDVLLTLHLDAQDA